MLINSFLSFQKQHNYYFIFCFCFVFLFVCVCSYLVDIISLHLIHNKLLCKYLQHIIRRYMQKHTHSKLPVMNDAYKYRDIILLTIPSYWLPYIFVSTKAHHIFPVSYYENSVCLLIFIFCFRCEYKGMLWAYVDVCACFYIFKTV